MCGSIQCKVLSQGTICGFVDLMSFVCGWSKCIGSDMFGFPFHGRNWTSFLLLRLRPISPVPLILLLSQTRTSSTPFRVLLRICRCGYPLPMCQGPFRKSLGEGFAFRLAIRPSAWASPDGKMSGTGRSSSLTASFTHLLWERSPFVPGKIIFSCLACPAFGVDCVALKQTASSLGSLHSMPKFLFELEERTFDSNVVQNGCVIPGAIHAIFSDEI